LNTQLTTTTENYSVRIVKSPGYNPAAPWNGSPIVPALIDDADGRVMRYLGYRTSLGDAADKAVAVMAGWFTPRHLISRVETDGVVELTMVVEATG
jgi:hypothetical protein